MSASPERLAGLGMDWVEWRPFPGARALPRVEPASVEECAEVLGHCARQGLRVLPVGGATRLGTLPDEADLALGTSRLSGVLDYESADGTLTARAGTPLAELEACVAAGGHHITPCAANAPRSTLGGLVASGESGYDRGRYGPLRHHVLGAKALLADGSVAQTGGKLVKNVTGYDLHRLYCGSWGSLVLLLEVSLRLFPLAEERIALRARLERSEALASSAAIRKLPLNPEALRLERAAAGSWQLTVLLAGRAAVVARELEALHAALPQAEILSGESAQSLRAELRDAERPEEPHLWFGTIPGRSEELVDRVTAAITAGGQRGRVCLCPITCTARFIPQQPEAESLARFHSHLVAASPGWTPFTWRWRNLTAELAAGLTLAGPPIAAGPRALMTRLRSALDPQQLFAGQVPGLGPGTSSFSSASDGVR